MGPLTEGDGLKKLGPTSDVVFLHCKLSWWCTGPYRQAHAELNRNSRLNVAAIPQKPRSSAKASSYPAGLPLKAKPGEFRIHGRKARRGEEGPQLDVLVGEGVADEVADYLRRQFIEPRFSFLHVLNPALAPDKSFLVELRERRYDLATFRLSIYLKGQAPALPRPQLMQQRPGILHARWSWVEDDHSPDLVCCWAQPCRRADSSLVLSLLSMPSLSAAERATRHVPIGRNSLSRYDLAPSSFRFLVRHLDVPTPAAP